MFSSEHKHAYKPNQGVLVVGCVDYLTLKEIAGSQEVQLNAERSSQNVQDIDVNISICDQEEDKLLTMQVF